MSIRLIHDLCRQAAPQPYRREGRPLENLVGLDGQASDIDVTDLDSLAKEYRAGLIDYGSFSGTCQFSLTDAGQMALRSSQAAAGPSSAFVITHKSGAILARFNSYCKQFSQSGGVDQVVDSNFSVKISGAVAYA